MLKKTLITVVGLALGVSPLSAGEVIAIQTLTPAEKWFTSEVQLDLFGGYHDAGTPDFGGGVAANYFLNENWGLGVEGVYWGDEDLYKYSTSLNVIYRYPFEELALAPYLVGGVGYTWEGVNDVLYSVGAGVDYRLTKNVGVFVEGRWNWLSDIESSPAVRAGLKVTF